MKFNGFNLEIGDDNKSSLRNKRILDNFQVSDGNIRRKYLNVFDDDGTDAIDAIGRFCVHRFKHFSAVSTDKQDVVGFSPRSLDLGIDSNLSKSITEIWKNRFV